MARSPKGSGFRRLRVALLAAIVLVAGGVAGLFYLGRVSRPPIATSAQDEAAAVSPDEARDQPTVLSEGFDYEQQLAGQPVFRLQGARFTTDRAGKVALEGVRLVLYRDGEPYEVRSQRALYDTETRDAELDGDVRVSGGDGWEIVGSRFDLVEGGRAVLSRDSRVHFRRGTDLAGSARRLYYNIAEQTLELAGQVHVAGREESASRLLRMTGDKMTWQRDGATVTAEGGVQLESGADLLSADRLDARLFTGGSELESATATGDVTGSMRSDEGAVFEFVAASATVEFDPSTRAPANALLAGGGTSAVATLTMRAAGTGLRTLSAPTVLVEYVAGRPARALASTGVELRDSLPGGVERVATGERLTASFTAAGELGEAQLSGRAAIHDATWTVEGELIELLDRGTQARVVGRPALARGERGELRAPQLTLNREAARLDAVGGVRARFRPASSPLAAGDAASAGQPVDLEAREATFHDAPRRFEFRGDVQAAQGESLLFADRLDGNEAASTATAVGNVRSQWTDRAPADQGGSPVVTVITAQRLDYQRGAGEAHYSGGVKVRQLRREISGDELLVEMASGGRARRMLVTGKVAIDDRETGRAVTGASADYDLESGEVLVLGEPVVLREQSGTVLRGRRAIFDQRTGSARLLSEAP